MAYNKEDLYEECISVACDYDIKFIEHLVEKIPCHKDTFYRLFPLKSAEYKSIVSIINANRMRIGYSNHPYSKNKNKLWLE